MKNMVSCGSGRNHGQETSSYSRNNEMNNLINYFWNYMDMPSTTGADNFALAEFEPRMQISETKEAVNIRAEIPGIEEKDLDLQVSSDGYLSISGEKKNMSEQQDKNAYFSEISYGTFKRTIPLPWDLDYDRVKATYKNGVLMVSIPKSSVEKQKFKKININAAQSDEHSAENNEHSAKREEHSAQSSSFGAAN